MILIKIHRYISQ